MAAKTEVTQGPDSRIIVSQVDDSTDKNLESVTAWAWVLVIGGVVIALFILFEIDWQGTGKGSIPFSELGDYLSGTVLGLWSLAGVLFLYAALLHQRKEIKLQSQALQRSQEEIEEQRRAREQQAADSTFQFLLRIHQERVQLLELHYTGQRSGTTLKAPLQGKGTAVFDILVDYIEWSVKVSIDHATHNMGSPTAGGVNYAMTDIAPNFHFGLYYSLKGKDKAEKDDFWRMRHADAMTILHDQFGGMIRPYLAGLFRLLTFIDQNPVSHKHLAYGLVTDSFTSSEIILLAFETVYADLLLAYGDYELLRTLFNLNHLLSKTRIPPLLRDTLSPYRSRLESTYTSDDT